MRLSTRSGKKHRQKYIPCYMFCLGMAHKYFSPRAHQLIASRGINRLATLQGVTLGTLSNSKPNAQVLLDAVVQGIGDKVSLASVIREAKLVPSEPAPPEVYANLAARCGAVIFASAD
jgi:hypothetical protein